MRKAWDDQASPPASPMHCHDQAAPAVAFNWLLSTLHSVLILLETPPGRASCSTFRDAHQVNIFTEITAGKELLELLN